LPVSESFNDGLASHVCSWLSTITLLYEKSYFLVNL
jgi:hypothetical protein